MIKTRSSRPAQRTHQRPPALVLALGLALVGVAGAQADTTVIGTASQTSSQASTMSQVGNNHVMPLPVIGANSSTGTQTGKSTLRLTEKIPLGTHGLLDGKANQANTQGAAATQLNAGSKTETNRSAAALGNSQLVGDGGIILADSSQTNEQANSVGQTLLGSKSARAGVNSALGNLQVAGGADQLILGSTGQASDQGNVSAQSISQKEGSPKLGNSALSATDNAVSNLDNKQSVVAATIIGSVLQGNRQGHSGSQKTQQTGASIVTGSSTPTQTDASSVTLGNCQTVDDGSASCLLLLG